MKTRDFLGHFSSMTFNAPVNQWSTAKELRQKLGENEIKDKDGIKAYLDKIVVLMPAQDTEAAADDIWKDWQDHQNNILQMKEIEDGVQESQKRAFEAREAARDAHTEASRAADAADGLAGKLSPWRHYVAWAIGFAIIALLFWAYFVRPAGKVELNDEQSGQLTSVTTDLATLKTAVADVKTEAIAAKDAATKAVTSADKAVTEAIAAKTEAAKATVAANTAATEAGDANVAATALKPTVDAIAADLAEVKATSAHADMVITKALIQRRTVRCNATDPACFDGKKTIEKIIVPASAGQVNELKKMLNRPARLDVSVE